MTAKQFKTRAEAAFRKSNPEAVTTGLVVTWNWCRKVKWADGSSGFSGQLVAAAGGYRPSTLMASWHDNEIVVR